jgi:protease-4
MFRRKWLAATTAALVLTLWGAPAQADDIARSKTLAHIKLSGEFDEAPPASDPLFGVLEENFKAKLDRIKKARKDSSISALYLELDGASLGWAKLDELSRVLADFRKSGKKVFAYLETGDPKDYLIALSCDEIAMPESGTLELIGMRIEVSFYKELFDKIGVYADFLKMGDFKGAIEPFTQTKLSEANRKQLTSVLDDYFEHEYVGRILKGRVGKKWTPEEVKKLIDQGPFTARTAHKLGLIDRLAYREGFPDTLKDVLKTEQVKVTKNYGKAKAEELDLSNPFAILKLLSPPKEKSSKNPKIAVIYATGAITTGKSAHSMFGGEGSCGSTTMIEAIRQAEEDKTVKAIVLRVDSPGGSALASDLIWNELVKCKKPVLASMSDVAASGGYYISMGAKKIYADPGTLTGSIGVFGGKLTLDGTFEKIGITTETISRGANANIFSSKPFSKSEREAMTAVLRDIYDQFLDKAVQGRKRAGKSMSRAELESLAGGRIWTGRQALANGLIDSLGSLDVAILEAQKLGGLPEDKEAELLLLPKSRSLLDALLDRMGDSDARQGELSQLQPLLRELPELQRKIRPVRNLLRLRGEPAWLMMPYQVEVR